MPASRHERLPAPDSSGNMIALKKANRLIFNRLAYTGGEKANAFRAVSLAPVQKYVDSVWGPARSAWNSIGKPAGGSQPLANMRIMQVEPDRQCRAHDGRVGAAPASPRRCDQMHVAHSGIYMFRICGKINVGKSKAAIMLRHDDCQ